MNRAIPNRRGLVKNIRIFNCSGIHEIGRVSWSFEERGNVVGAGWGSDEMLYVICENGELSQFSPSGKRTTNQFNLFSKYMSVTSTTKHRVLMVAWWPSRDGFALLTDEVRIWASDIRRSNQFHFGTDLPPVRVEPVTGVLSGVSAKRLPSVMTVVECKHNKSRRMEVLLALWGSGYEGASVGVVYTEYDDSFSSRRRKNRGSAKMLSEQSIMAMPLISEHPSPIVQLAMHCEGRIVAAICKNGSVVMFATDFTERIMDFYPILSSVESSEHHLKTKQQRRARRRKYSEQIQTNDKLLLSNDLGSCTAYWSGRLLRCAPTLAVMWKRNSSSKLLLLDIEGNFRWEEFGRDTIVISEVDGFRILSATSMEMIHISETSDMADALVNVSAEFGTTMGRRRST